MPRIKQYMQLKSNMYQSIVCHSSTFQFWVEIKPIELKDLNDEKSIIQDKLKSISR